MWTEKSRSCMELSKWYWIPLWDIILGVFRWPGWLSEPLVRRSGSVFHPRSGSTFGSMSTELGLRFGLWQNKIRLLFWPRNVWKTAIFYITLGNNKGIECLFSRFLNILVNPVYTQSREKFILNRSPIDYNNAFDYLDYARLNTSNLPDVYLRNT